jgi:uncharacterized DUF497 family protein
MERESARALATIRRCVARDRVRLTRHFRTRLAERGLVWPDVITVIDSPSAVQGQGTDDAGRDRWVVGGEAADGTPMVIVCAIGRDTAGELTVFITAFWENHP